MLIKVGLNTLHAFGFLPANSLVNFKDPVGLLSRFFCIDVHHLQVSDPFFPRRHPVGNTIQNPLFDHRIHNLHCNHTISFPHTIIKHLQWIILIFHGRHNLVIQGQGFIGIINQRIPRFLHIMDFCNHTQTGHRVFSI